MRLSGRTFLMKGNQIMPNYKEMYRKLFIAVTQATEILKEAQIECEELYINSSEDDDDKVKEFKIIAPKDK